MDKIVINGGRTLVGTVSSSGSKNAALPLMAATLLTHDKFVLKNIPVLRDILTMTAVLRTLGAECVKDDDKHSLAVNTRNVNKCEAPYDLVRTMRASVVVLGPLLGRYGQARVSMPGGCAIGTRPVDIHLSGLEKLGAVIKVNQGYIEAVAPRGLKGAEYEMRFPSVGATQNIMMAAALASGRTIIRNAAYEPENQCLADMLNRMGARVSWPDPHTVVIEGVKSLKGVEFKIPPDRVETGTLILAGAITGGQVTVTPARPAENQALWNVLDTMGFDLEIGEDYVTILPGKPKHTVCVKTEVYPDFATDLQAQLMVLCCVADGVSRITESIFENRFMHINELRRLGADIMVDGHTAIISGGKPLIGAPVMASDLRASAALILAGLIAQGRTDVRRVYHIDRGYEAFEKKLTGLGADIKRIRDEANS